jgi:hypothetical protein
MNTQPQSDRVVPTRPRRWRSIQLNLYVYVVVALLVFVSAVPLAQAANFWSVSGKLTGTGQKVAATGLDPAEIKGWMKISEVIAAYNVPQADFYAAFSLPADMPLDTPLNTIEKVVTGFSVDKVRTWLTARAPK